MAERQVDGSRAHLYQAVALGHLGRQEEARTALETSKAIEPDVLNDLERLRPYKHPVDHDSFIDGLRKAGWSED